MTDADFQSLLEHLADEPAAEEVFERLDPDTLTAEQRRELAHFLRTQTHLRAEIGGADAFARRVMSWAEGDRQTAFTTRVMDARQAKRRGPARWQQALPWALAAAACLAAMASWLPRESGVPATGGLQDGAVAVLVDELQSRFASGRSPRKSGFAPGQYQLEDGLAHLRMINGTDLVLKAPVQFEIISPMRVRLTGGDMRVVVPEMAQGFIVATEGVDYQDLGTEFGVSASTDGKTSSMHVFDGQVDVLKKDGAKLESVTLGKGVAFDSGGLKAAPAPEPGRYPRANEIGLRRWEALSAGWRRDASLVAYYTFHRDAAHPDQLSDAKAPGSPVHGSIKGARWVTGRWPGKQALFFDRNDDHVALEIPGEYTSFTVAAWVLLDRLDFVNNAVFASDGWEAGDFHMNLTSSGKPFGGAWPRTEYAVQNLHPLKPGVWTLVVLAVDGERHTSRAWVNGQLSTDGRVVKPGQPLRPGSCRIGGCLVRPDEGNPVRTLRGRVDEVFVWNRALEGDEISRLYESGRPSLLEAARQTTDAP